MAQEAAERVHRDRLKAAGQDETFLSKENLLRLQQGFGPMFRELDKEHPRMSQIAKELVYRGPDGSVRRQSFSESMLKEHGALLHEGKMRRRLAGQEVHLWEQYQKFRRWSLTTATMPRKAKAIASRIQQVDLSPFKSPWNVHYASHEPERTFSDLLV
jgi:type III restriction enzyme